MSDDKNNDSVPSADDHTGQIEEPAKDEVAGLLSAKEAEVKKRQEAEAKLSAAEQYGRTMEELLNQKSQGENQEAAFDYDPEDYPNNSSVEGMIRKQLAKELEPLKQNTRTNVLMQQENTARLKYKDYDEVINTYWNQKIAETPDLAKGVQDGYITPDVAYQIATSHPDYQKKQIEEQARATSDKIAKNLEQPPSITGGGPVDLDAIKKIESMSSDDLNNEIERIKRLPRNKAV